jgi:hypothetical protein
MVDWYLAPALAVGRSEINGRWPNRDRTSDGTIGDPPHAARKSDHNPNARGSVNALDIDATDVNMRTILDAFERHPSAHYWIFNRQIADADNDWRRLYYSGENPHTNHAHMSIRQEIRAEQDRRAWGIHPSREEDLLPDERQMLKDVLYVLTSVDPPEGGSKIHVAVATERILNKLNQLQTQQSSMHTSLLNAISAIGKLDPEAFTAALAASPEALSALTSAMKAQLPLIPTAKEVARAFIDLISGNVHNGQPS